MSLAKVSSWKLIHVRNHVFIDCRVLNGKLFLCGVFTFKMLMIKSIHVTKKHKLKCYLKGI